MPNRGQLKRAEIAVAKQRAEWAIQRIAIAKRRELLFEILLGPAQRAEMIMPVDAWENEGGAVLPAGDYVPEAVAIGRGGARQTGGGRMSDDLRIIFGDLFFTTDNVVLANGIVPLNEIFLDGPIDPAAREGEPVTVAGTINEAQTRMAVEKFVRHQSVAERAYEIFASGKGGTAEENWVRAEKELLVL